MKLTILATLLFSFSALANNSYQCQGKNLKMIMTLDWFGEGIKEEIRGTYNGTSFKYSPQQDYRPTPDIRKEPYSTIEGLQTFSYYKHPQADIVIRVTDPTVATVDDLYFNGLLIINGSKVNFECFQ